MPYIPAWINWARPSGTAIKKYIIPSKNIDKFIAEAINNVIILLWFLIKRILKIIVAIRDKITGKNDKINSPLMIITPHFEKFKILL